MDEDIHICGSCKGQFGHLEEFISHKRQCRARLEVVNAPVATITANNAAETVAISENEAGKSDMSQGKPFCAEKAVKKTHMYVCVHVFKHTHFSELSYQTENSVLF